MDIITFSEIASLLSISDRLRKVWAKSDKPETITDRFICLFEKHGVHRNQIPSFVGHDISHDDIDNHEKLLSKLTPDILQSTCDLFGVRLEWLYGVDNEIYPINYFDKGSDEYVQFLSKLTVNNPHHITANLVISMHSSWEHDSILILQEHIDDIGEMPIYRYHLCIGWIHKYWNSRPDLTTCIAATLKQRISMKGRLTQSKVNTFCAGEGFVKDLNLLPPVFKRDRYLRKHLQQWHPDKWIYDPICFLDGITEGEFGKISALERWLDYFDKGLMETNYHRNHVRAQFADILVSIENYDK